MVLYNEHNPDDEAIGSVTKDDLRRRPDAVIVVGTTLKVPGVRRIVREMCGSVRDRRGGVAIWINNDLPPVAKDLEDCFDIVVQANCDEVANRAARSKWDEVANAENFNELSDEDARKADANTLQVHIHTSGSPKQELDREYLDSVSLPSENHYNNSFSPPPIDVSTPKKMVKTHPVDWSPITQHKSLVLESIESGALRADSTVTSGLLTPSKSRKTTPAGQPISINDKLKAEKKSSKAAPKGKGSKGPIKAKSKSSNVKYIKPASKTKAANVKSAGPMNASLVNAFSTTKTASVEAKTNIKVKSLTAGSPKKSQLSHVLNASPKKASPMKPMPFFPGFASDNACPPKDPVSRIVF